MFVIIFGLVILAIHFSVSLFVFLHPEKWIDYQKRMMFISYGHTNFPTTPAWLLRLVAVVMMLVSGSIFVRLLRTVVQRGFSSFKTLPADPARTPPSAFQLVPLYAIFAVMLFVAVFPEKWIRFTGSHRMIESGWISARRAVWLCRLVGVLGVVVGSFLLYSKVG